MAPRRRGRPSRSPHWSRPKMCALLAAAILAVALLVAGLVLGIASALGPTPPSGRPQPEPALHTASGDAPAGGGADVENRDALAARPMPTVPDPASRPGPVSNRDPGPPILLPAATGAGPAGVPTGFPRTPEGALAQLAAIDQTALQSGSLPGARAVVIAWALPGGPTTTSWSGVRAMSALLTATGLSGGGSPQLAVALTPLMGQIKGSEADGDGRPEFVVPCVDFELDVTVQQTARAAVADCQRMVWHVDRWMIGPGEEPAPPPSVWPGTDTAIAVGYRDLRHG